MTKALLSFLFFISSNYVFAQQPKLMLSIGHTDDITSVKFSPGEKKIVTASNDDTAKVWDVAIGKLIANLAQHTENVNSAVFSNDGKKIATASDDNTAIIWDAETGKIIVILNGHKQKIESAIFSPNGREIRTFSYYDSNTKIWDADCGVLISDLKEFTNDARDYSFSTNWEKIVIPTDDNSAKIWEAQSKKVMFTLYIIDTNDYLIKIPSNYYFSSIGAARQLHYVTNKSKIITFEQLDIKYNRPDKVLEAIGYQYVELINSYKKAYEKRIEKLDINTTAFNDGYSVLEDDFENRDSVEYEQKNETLTLHIFIPDSKKIGMKNSFELMQELFVNVGRSTGATIISAAGGTQFALEDGGLKNGVFTYSILEFLKDNPETTISKLKEYVNKRVPELTQGMQVPSARTETNVIDWMVW